MPLTNYSFDNFVAPHLSKLTLCNAEALPDANDFLCQFILSNIFQVRYARELRALLFNFIRRVEQASYEYEQGRINLGTYVTGPRDERVAVYFRSLAHFEQCVAVLYQAAMFRGRMKSGCKPVDIFDSDDGSFLDRVNKIYNHSHHMDKRIVDRKIEMHATTHVWLTNDSVTTKDANVTFSEIRDELVAMRTEVKSIVEDWPRLIAERQQAGSPAD